MITAKKLILSGIFCTAILLSSHAQTSVAFGLEGVIPVWDDDGYFDRGFGAEASLAYALSPVLDVRTQLDYELISLSDSSSSVQLASASIGTGVWLSQKKVWLRFGADAGYTLALIPGYSNPKNGLRFGLEAATRVTFYPTWPIFEPFVSARWYLLTGNSSLFMTSTNAGVRLRFKMPHKAAESTPLPIPDKK
jgi:hypothetical protein